MNWKKEQKIMWYVEKVQRRILLTGTLSNSKLEITSNSWKHRWNVDCLLKKCKVTDIFEHLVDESGNTIDEMDKENLTNRYLGNINCACFTPNTEKLMI